MPFRLRQALLSDVPALTPLIAASVRGLQQEHYSEAQREAALKSVFGVDTQLILDGTYFAVEESKAESRIIGCGGWGKRKTLCGGDHFHGRQEALLDPATDAAKIRAFFVHPEWARRGIGTMLLQTCEAAAVAAGFQRFEMGATLSGVALYEARNYIARDRIEVPLSAGLTLTVVRMEKSRIPSPS